jgi:hypothetical protein
VPGERPFAEASEAITSASRLESARTNRGDMAARVSRRAGPARAGTAWRTSRCGR